MSDTDTFSLFNVNARYIYVNINVIKSIMIIIIINTSWKVNWKLKLQVQNTFSTIFLITYMYRGKYFMQQLSI